MFYYAAIFFLVALLASILGLGVIAGTATTIAKILFVAFLVLFVVALPRGRKSLA